jgi:hypothetical protein
MFATLLPSKPEPVQGTVNLRVQAKLWCFLLSLLNVMHVFGIIHPRFRMNSARFSKVSSYGSDYPCLDLRESDMSGRVRVSWKL